MSEPLRDSFGDFLVNYADKYENMVVLDVDLSSSTRTYKFAEKFPSRFFNFGIAEQNMVGAAMGFAISGKIPIVSGFAIFTTGRAWEFIRMACHDNLNIKFVLTHAGFVGEDGSSHNALEDLSIMASLPNMNILVPSDNIELESMLKYALERSGPFYIRLPRSSLPVVHHKNYQFSPVNPDIIKEGDDVCLMGVGFGTSLARKFVEKLENDLNISIKIINQSLIKPIKTENLIEELKSIKAVILIEEHNYYCGVGNIISRILSQNLLKPIRILGVRDTFGESGKREEILSSYGFNYENLRLIIEDIL